MYIAAFITNKPGAAEARSESFEAFRAYLHNHPAHPDVVVHHGGPTLADDGESIVGLVLVIEAPSLDAARAFLDDSPYAKAGIFAERELREWEWATGRPGQ